ncbi:hypothetical protein GFL95_12735 [Rhizobium leguminosarum bv. viciae]|uniref:hypothetical protein n=1 Tax=Rhizobium leguminosarum TaxID=384 RepID=UPI001441C5A5|nr:hypothetical protein [Rhizobium leguminosarum]NKK92087.1 hypothetical protein [Rhizobium leguminosarum bv. viciae]
MSETNAVNHICEVREFDEAGAKRALYDEFMAGKVEAHALVAEFKKTNTFWKSHREWQQLDLSLTGWRHSIVEWDNGCILISMNKPHELLSIVATGIEFQRADVLGVWPAQKSEETATVIQSAPRSGRMLKYDWPNAAMFLGSRVWRDDLTETQARDLLKEWFAERGATPDDKELRNWVAAFFEDERKGGK